MLRTEDFARASHICTVLSQPLVTSKFASKGWNLTQKIRFEWPAVPATLELKERYVVDVRARVICRVTAKKRQQTEAINQRQFPGFPPDIPSKHGVGALSSVLIVDANGAIATGRGVFGTISEVVHRQRLVSFTFPMLRRSGYGRSVTKQALVGFTELLTGGDVPVSDHTISVSKESRWQQSLG